MKPLIHDNEKVIVEDTVTYFKSSREVKQCAIYLTDKRVIAYNKPQSIIKSFANLFRDSEMVFEVPLHSISSIREGRQYQKDIVILKTEDGTEYPLLLNLPIKRWKNSVSEAISKSESGVTIREVGDYIRFKRQPRSV